MRPKEAAGRAQIPRRDFLGAGVALAGVAAGGPVLVSAVQAQPQKPFRIGVVHEGGEYSKMVDGLEDGLRELGLEPGRDVLLDVRAVEGDRTAVGESARSLEQAKVALICTPGNVRHHRSERCDGEDPDRVRDRR